MMRRTLIADGGILDYDPEFLSRLEADHLVKVFNEEVHWEQKEYTNFRTGQKIPQPRLTAWYADRQDMAYTYSGVTQKVQFWFPELAELKSKVERVTNANYNSVLLNLYRDGNDSVGLHADDEKELGTNATIASVSLGATRTFRLKHMTQNAHQMSYPLSHGSLLVMSGTVQHYWKHEVPKERSVTEPRINLTFRWFHNLK